MISPPGFNFSVVAKGLVGKSVSDMTYLVSSGMLNLNSVNLDLPNILSDKNAPKNMWLSKF